MPEYKIHPIALCRGPRDLSQYTYCRNIGTPCASVSYIWYLEGSQPKTLIDAGAKAGGGFPDKLDTVEDGLVRLGLKPEDIEIIILTHLHHDHIELAHLYKNAKFIVQKKELDYARNPHPIDAHLYRKDLFGDLPFELVDGEKEIIPGVTVFPTPGHSPGGQSVEIRTAAGKAIITGFCCLLATLEQTEAMKKAGLEVSAPLIHQDVRDVYDSALEVKRRADIILSTHDPACIGKETVG